MHCPLGEKKRDCWQCEYGKEGLCDWPYYLGMSYEEMERLSRGGGDDSLGILDIGFLCRGCRLLRLPLPDSQSCQPGNSGHRRGRQKRTVLSGSPKDVKPFMPIG